MWTCFITADIFRNKSNLMWIMNFTFTCVWFYLCEILGPPSAYFLVRIYMPPMCNIYSPLFRIPPAIIITVSSQNHESCHLIGFRCTWGSLGVVPLNTVASEEYFPSTLNIQWWERHRRTPYRYRRKTEGTEQSMAHSNSDTLPDTCGQFLDWVSVLLPGNRFSWLLSLPLRSWLHSLSLSSHPLFSPKRCLYLPWPQPSLMLLILYKEFYIL